MTRLDRVGLMVLLLFVALVLYLAACDEPPAGATPTGAALVGESVHDPSPSSSGGGGM